MIKPARERGRLVGKLGRCRLNEHKGWFMHAERVPSEKFNSGNSRKAKIIIVDGRWVLITPYRWTCMIGRVNSTTLADAVESLKILMDY